MFAVKETITFMADETFSATLDYDDGVTREIRDDVSTNNPFTTTRSQEPGSGTYSISAHGVLTVNFAEDDPDTISGVLSADGQIAIFGYNDFDATEKFSSYGIGVGVKKAGGTRKVSSTVFPLLNE